MYIYTFMEWIFFITKPSFMSGMSIWLQINVLFVSALGMSVLPLLIVILLWALERGIRNPPFTQYLTVLGLLISSLIISTMILLLVDNFTYTVFKFGVVSTERISRAAYGFLFILLTVLIYVQIKQYVVSRSVKKYPVKRSQKVVFSGLLALSAIFSIVSMMNSPANVLAATQVSPTDNLPNIILLGSDGLDATHLSAYGYERDTTPYINTRLQDALVAENAFPNGGTTAGSVASILTGKLPIATRVIYPPDILQGEDSYQHLPGILKRLGYQAVDLSVPYFGDALTLNMQGGFDVANQRSGKDHPVVKVTRLLGGGDSAYFVDTMIQRVSDRLLHIFFIQPMINPIEKVIEPASREDEQKRFNELVSTLKQAQAPVFVHVHMLGTHGPRFEIREQVFSAGQTQDTDWMINFYDDSILNFDRYVGELFNYLGDSGTLKNTIVIIYSDHGRRWTVHDRMPLLFWFPDGKHAGRISDNVQNIDIAPTILDYIGIPIPKWMAGQSLIDDFIAPDHIFSSSVDASLIEVSKDGIWVTDAGRKAPPFYQVGYVGLVACDQWFELYVKNPGMSHGKVKGHSGSCASAKALSTDEAERLLLEHLSRNGFDVSSFPGSIPVQFVE
jgi:hypothetical protein